VINEAVELSKRFGADKGYKLVNGVLDKVAGDIRPDEHNA
jgi:N utilization substance protein B